MPTIDRALSLVEASLPIQPTDAAICFFVHFFFCLRMDHGVRSGGWNMILAVLSTFLYTVKKRVEAKAQAPQTPHVTS